MAIFNSYVKLPEGNVHVLMTLHVNGFRGKPDSFRSIFPKKPDGFTTRGLWRLLETSFKGKELYNKESTWSEKMQLLVIWAMVNTHYMVDGHPIHNKDPYNGYYKSLWTIGWLAPTNGY